MTLIKPMNVSLWILQSVLGVYFIIGATYMLFNYKMLATPQALSALPQFAWITLGVLQILFSLGLILPGIVNRMHMIIPLSAVGLAVISLFGSFIYIAYKGFGFLWALIPAAFLAFVAYERYKMIS